MIIEREFLEEIKALASVFIESSKGQPIAIFLDRSPSLVASLAAAYNAGIPYIPLDPEHPRERICSILEEARPEIVLTQKHLFNRLPSWTVKLDVDEILSEGRKQEDFEFPTVIDPETPAYIIFTSGSTGKPKGVVIPRRAMNNFLLSMEKKPGMTSRDRLLAITTVSFDISVLEIFLPLRTGAGLYLLDKDDSRDPDAIIKALHEYDITLLQATPATWKMLIDAGWQGKNNLKALCGGEALTPGLADALLDRCGELWNMYGPTETTVWSTLERVERGRAISIGEPIDNTQIYILNENLEPLPPGTEGDLYIGGTGLALGYYNRPDLTRKTFIPNPFIEGGIIYKTGDLARYGEGGRLECLGRNDFQVKIRGFRIELGEIESTLLKRDDIRNAVVHPQILRKGMKELVAYIIYDTPLNREQIVNYLALTLPDYMIPSHYVFLDRFPMNTNGKIDRKNLPLPEIAHERDGEMDLTGLDLEQKILAVWRNVLRLSSIGPDQNFFELGGNSILAVQALREIRELCSLSLPLGVFFKKPVVRDILKWAASEYKAEDSVILLNRGGPGIPLFCLGGIDIYSDLAGYFDGERPVYGVFLPYEEQLIDHIQRDSLEGWEYLSIKGMAAAYLRDIRRHYPMGPCHFLGVSIAGMIAFEASEIIKRNEGERGELFILDSHLPHARELTILGRGVNFLKRIGRGSSAPILEKNQTVLNPEYVAAMRDYINDQAIEEFDREAKPISGNLYLIKALVNVYGRGESYRYDLGWNDLVRGNVEILELSGDHLGILKKPHVKELSRFLKQKMT